MADDEFRALLDSFDDQRILVVGDLMIDEYVHGTIERVSPEAPVQIVDVTKEEMTLGGAGNVLKNLHALDADASILSVLGTEEHSGLIRDRLEDIDVGDELLAEEEGRISSKKTRVLAESYNQQIIRIDRETRDPIDERTHEDLINKFHEQVEDLDAIILSDYGKGLLTPVFARELIKTADEHSVPVIADPKGTNYSKYSGSSTITPNTTEAEQAAELDIDDDSSLQRTGEKLLKQYSFESLLITRGADGMALFESPGVSFTSLDAQAREVYDVTGAGDTVVSLMGLGLAGAEDVHQAAELANRGAGIVVGKVGTATVNRDELLESFQQAESSE